MRVSLGGFLKVVVLAVVAVALVARGVARADHDGEHPDAGHGETHEATAKHPAAHAHHEPSALHHVMDAEEDWEFFDVLGYSWKLPKIFGFQITKFMVLEVIAAILIVAIYWPLARRAQSGDPVRGWKDNAFEVLLTFIRDEVAKPSIGEHDADKFVPFLWTLFLFILFNNLLGMFPFGGSATASIYVTGALALCVFVAIHGSAIRSNGLAHYIGSFWPHFDMHWAAALPIKGLIFFIEIIGVLVRNAVLAVRLFANMFAGHMVLATILIFIYAARELNPAVWGVISLSSVLGILALSLLEIFVAFLQAYIFVFLSAIFIGLAVHPEH